MKSAKWLSANKEPVGGNKKGLLCFINLSGIDSWFSIWLANRWRKDMNIYWVYHFIRKEKTNPVILEMKGKKSKSCLVAVKKNPHVEFIFGALKSSTMSTFLFLCFQCCSILSNKKKEKKGGWKGGGEWKGNDMQSFNWIYIYFSCALMLNVYFRSTSVTKRVQRWNIWIPLFVYLSLL